jgi:hypothetical protein
MWCKPVPLKTPIVNPTYGITPPNCAAENVKFQKKNLNGPVLFIFWLFIYYMIEQEGGKEGEWGEGMCGVEGGN